MFRRLTLPFEHREQFVQEYQRNLANGGVFVPTTDSFEAREVVEVEMDLRFCDRSVALQAEVVSQIPASLEGAGAAAGVAVQFLVPADELRDLLGGIAGVAAPPPPPPTWPGREGAVRQMERTRACVLARLESRGRTQKVRSRNLSRSGVLVTIDEAPLPIGDQVKLTLIHPTRDEELTLSARVTRHVQSHGRTAALGIQFDLDSEAAVSTERMIDDLRAAAHAHQLGGIRGPLETLGLPNLLQMFASASAGGTLTVVSDDEEGRVVFENGALRHAAIGPVVGLKSLARMMEWEHGGFWFLPDIDPDEPASDAIPIYGAVLEAVTQLDELRRLDRSTLRPEATVTRDPEAESPTEMDKIEDSILDLATAHMTVGGILDSLPDFDTEIYASLLSLAERGLVAITSS